MQLCVARHLGPKEAELKYELLWNSAGRELTAHAFCGLRHSVPSINTHAVPKTLAVPPLRFLLLDLGLCTPGGLVLPSRAYLKTKTPARGRALSSGFPCLGF